MAITSTSLAYGVGVGVNNQTFVPSASVIARNIVVIATYDPGKSTVVANVPVLIGSAAQAASLYTAGFMIHRLIVQIFAATGGSVPVWAIPQAEVAGAQATGTILYTAPPTAAGNVMVYVAGIQYAIPVTATTTAIQLAGLLAAAVTADSNNPCTCTNSGTATATFTVKSKGTWGLGIALAHNINPGDAFPAGVAATVTQMTGGTGVPVLANALNALGTGSNSNTLPPGAVGYMTDLVWGYLGSGSVPYTPVQDQTSITAAETYNGLSNTTPPSGCYDHSVSRPFRYLLADVTPSASIPSAATTLASTNLYGRAGGMIERPGSNTHPCEIAAIAVGLCAKTSATTAETNYVNQTLVGVDPGWSSIAAGNDWAGDYNNRNTAVLAGLSPTIIIGGYVVLQNVMTFATANPAVAIANNGYRSYRNIAILQNILANWRVTFTGTKWQGYTVVSDPKNVTVMNSRLKARGIQDVADDVVALLKAYEQNAWIPQSAWSIQKIASPSNNAIQIRTDGAGFTVNCPIVLSGEGLVIDSNVNFDISFLALNS